MSVDQARRTDRAQALEEAGIPRQYWARGLRAEFPDLEPVMETARETFRAGEPWAVCLVGYPKARDAALLAAKGFALNGATVEIVYWHELVGAIETGASIVASDTNVAVVLAIPERCDPPLPPSTYHRLGSALARVSGEGCGLLLASYVPVADSDLGDKAAEGLREIGPEIVLR